MESREKKVMVASTSVTLVHNTQKVMQSKTRMQKRLNNYSLHLGSPDELKDASTLLNTVMVGLEDGFKYKKVMRGSERSK